MKIDVNAVQAVNLYKVTNKNAGVAKSSYVQPNDQIEVSNDAMLFADVFQAAKADMDARLDSPEAISQLAEMKHQIQSGTYQVVDQELAAAILLTR